MDLSEPLEGLFANSRVVILDYLQIPEDAPTKANIKKFFESTSKLGLNPRLPENRQSFNDKLLNYYRCRYLIGRYAEDRVAMLADSPAGKEGRTIHMAIDIFTSQLEPVLAPISGTIVKSAYEEGLGEYGNYLILKPDTGSHFIFFGHLSNSKNGLGPVKKGQTIAHLGDYTNAENGGWSRHLHLQILSELPPEDKTPDGYSTGANFSKNQQLYPNPMAFFPEWQLQ